MGSFGAGASSGQDPGLWFSYQGPLEIVRRVQGSCAEALSGHAQAKSGDSLVLLVFNILKIRLI